MTAILVIHLIPFDKDIHITEKMTQVEPANITEEQLKQKYSTWKYF